MDFDIKTSACFTGHRSYPINRQTDIIMKTDEVISSLYYNGYRTFIAGGAIGFDTLAACRVVIAKRTRQDIKLILALPCRNQTERWPSGDSLKLYKYLLGEADEVIYVSPMYEDGCMMKRNRWMVDNSSVCIAYYRGTKGGTSATYYYALEQGKTIYNVYE